ncbi:MAG: DNA-directed RNA polymerase subunit H [Candidatus Micrarchaeaceae archaeon]
MVKESIHEYVPVHTILSVDQSKKMLENLGLKPENLPKLSSSNTQAVYIKAKPGDIVEVKRNDYGKEYLYYRFVVEG